MNHLAVLLIGSDDSRELRDKLFEVGLVPVEQRTMSGALDKVKRNTFAAVVMDRDNTNADPLEFALNVRDIDERIPLLLLASAPPEEPLWGLLADLGTYQIQWPASTSALQEEFARLGIAGSEGKLKHDSQQL